MYKSKIQNKKVAYVGPTPAYYFVPFLRELATKSQINMTVYWGCDETLNNYKEKEFSAEVKANENLLKGYKYKIVKNIIGKASYQKGFFGLNSFEFYKEFWRCRYDVVIIHGWQYLNNINAILAAKMSGAEIILRSENPLNQEFNKPLWKKILKRLIFPFMFKFIDKFLFISTQNKDFYKYFGANEKQLFFSPYSVDNKWHRSYEIRNKSSREQIRKQYDIKNDDVVFLFVGKFIDKKNPKILIEAIKKLDEINCKLILVGAGDLGEELKQYVQKEKLTQVIFAGFQSQKNIRKFYLLADIFVLPSGDGETWGLVINESLNFGLPLIISDMVGSARDLCTEKNGLIFKYNNLDDLCRCMKFFIREPVKRKLMSQASRELVKMYSSENTASGILDAIYPP